MRNHWLVLLMVVGVLVAPSVALSAECVRGPAVLPGIGGPPVWFDPGGGGAWWPELHDPRWSGSPLRRLSSLSAGSGLGTGDEAQVRAVFSGGKLYFSYQIRALDTPTGLDAVYLAFKAGASGEGAFALKIQPVGAIGGDTCNNGGACAAVAAPPAGVPKDPTLPARIPDQQITYWQSVNATSDTTPDWGLAQNTTPTWLKETALWTGSPGVSWGVTFVIDTSASGLNLTGATKMFFGVQIDDPEVVLSGNVTPKDDADTDKIPTTVIPWLTTQWAEVDDPGTCPGGITMNYTDVGVWDGASLTNQICANGACGTGVNTFQVTAHKVKDPAFNWMIRARIRVAAWGATIADPNAPWIDIPGSNPAGTLILTGDPTPFTGANGWDWNITSTGGGENDARVRYTCTKQGTDTYCPKLPDETEEHQCMLIELGQRTTGPAAQRFQDTFVYRNMDYVDLSTVARPAKVSIAGLQKVAGTAVDRDVYLHVERHNMPAHGDKEMALPRREMELARRLAENPPVVPEVEQPPGKGGKQAPKRAPVAKAESALANRLAVASAVLPNDVPVSSALAMNGPQLLDSVWPTYRVRVYFDTGRVLTTRGTKRKVLSPMVPFGFHLSHDGSFFGFTDSLTGLDGAVVEKIKDDWYVVRKVKAEGSFRVTTTVTAEEKPKTSTQCPTCPACPPPPAHHGHCHCRMVGPAPGGAGGAAAAVLLGLAAVLRRKKRRSGRAPRPVR